MATKRSDMDSRKPRTGSLFKRLNGRYLPASSSVRAMFYMRVQIGGTDFRKTIALGTYDKREAEQALAQYVANIRYGDRRTCLERIAAHGERMRQELLSLNQEANAVTLANAWSAYLQSKRRPKSGAKLLGQYESQWNRFAVSLPKSAKTLRDISSAGCERYIEKFERTATKATTIRRHVAFLRLMYGVLDPGFPNPWAGLSPTKDDDRTPYRRLTLDECRTIYNAAEGEWRILVTVGYTTGLRLADAVLLEWDQIDLQNRLITVLPRKTARKKPEPYQIPLLPDLAALLAPRAQQTGYVMPGLSDLYKRDQSKVSKDTSALFRSCGVSETREGKASFHSFRVTWQSLNDEAGTSRVFSRYVLRHSGPSMSDTYSRLDAQRVRVAVEKALPSLS